MRIVSPELKRTLRARAHSLKPVVIIADRGLEDSVIAEVNVALERHELIKVRIRHDRETRSELAVALCERCGAALIHRIGQIVVIYRPRPPASQATGREDERSRPWRNASERKRVGNQQRGTRNHRT